MTERARYHQTLFLSDLHLGALGGRSDLVLAFLQQNHAETYVLVGDILDLWQPLLPHWSGDDQKVLDHLKARQKAGSVLHYLRGNHDPDPKLVPPEKRLDGAVLDEMVHIARDGRRYLVLHGDVVDGRLIRSHLMTRIGSRIDHGFRVLDRFLSVLSRRTSTRTRTSIEALLSFVNALSYRSRQHEARLIALARKKGVDGVICGHFHIAALHRDHGLIYANCGDWLDSMTALAEAQDGALHLLSARATTAATAQNIPSFNLESV